MLTKSNDITPENEEVDWVEIPDLSSTEEEEVDWQPSGEEQQFQEWYQNWSEKTGINPDPDDPRHKYDYRAAHEAGAEPIISAEDNKYHWPSEFKADDHPNRFVDGKDTKYQGGGQAQAQEPVEDPDDIWSDSSFTGEKPIDEGPSMWQKIVPGLASGMGGPFIEPILYAATGTEPYRAPDADPGAFEPRKGMTEGWKSLVKSGSRALQMITAHEADLPDVAGYNLEDPISRSSYYLALLKSKAFNETNEIVEPIFSKLTELEQLQPDLDYYSRLENKSTFVKYAEEVVGMAPQIATQVAAHAAGGGIGSGIWMALQIAGSEYDSLIRDGADPERAEAAAWASALMQAPIEALSLGFMLNNPITRKFVKGGIVKFGLDRIIGGATEFITETVQKVPSKFWENWAQDPEYLDKLRENPEMLQALVAQGLKEGMKEGWVAAFYGAVLGGSGSAKPTPKTKGLNLPEGTQKILNTLANEVIAGTRTTEDIETMREGLDPSHPLYGALGGLLEVSTPGETSGAESAAKDGLEAGERLTRLEEITIGALKQDGNYKEGETLEAVRVVESKKKRVNDAVKIFKAIGLDAIVYRGKGKIDGFNGMMDTETGQIYLNETAKDPYITVLAHESAHRLKKDHPDLYNKLEKTLKGMMTAGDLDITEYLAETNKNRLAAGVPKLILEDALSTEEFIADLVGHQFGEKPFWNKLHKANPTLGKQLAQIVSDLLDAIKSAMRKNKSVDAKVFRDLNNMQDAIASVYAEFSRREAKVKPVEKTMTAEEKAAKAAARAADMPFQVEFDHIVKGLKGDQRKAAQGLIDDTEAPIRERLAKLKELIKPKPAKTGKEKEPEATQGEKTPQQEYDALVAELTPAQLKDKAIKNVIDDKTSAVSQRTGTLKNAIAAYDKKNPPKKAKESKRGLNVRTLRGAILAAGGIKWGDQFKGERKTMAENNPGAMYLTRQKTGMPWDTLEQQLKADGWLGPEEVLLDVLNDPLVLKRGRVTGDLMEKKDDHLTAQEKEVKADIEHETEEPPPGDYQTMDAEDLPVGKKLTLIENESTRGWDVYTVVEKDPFGVTLKDGVTIELAPNDKVQVRKADIAASVKKLELTGEKAMGAKEAELKSKRRTRSAGRQESLGLWEPAPKGDWLQGEKATAKEAKAMKKPTKPEAPVKVHWAEEIKGNRKAAIEYMYRVTYEASKQYPTTAHKDLVAVHVWDKPGEGNKIIDIRYATRENVDAIENKARDDYPDAWVTLDYDLKPYTPRQGEISYKKYAIERDKGIERPEMIKPAKPEQGRLPGFSVKNRIPAGLNATSLAVARGGRLVADLISEAEALSKKVNIAYETGNKNAEDLDAKLDVIFEKLDSRLTEIEEEEETFDDESDVMADIGARYHSMVIDKNSIYYTESDKEIADTIRSMFDDYGPNKSSELTDAEVIGIAEDAYLSRQALPGFSVKKADPWYSQMRNALDVKLPGKGTPAQIKSVIQAAARKGEFKVEELEWSGVEDWLDEQKGKVTKDQVMDYLAANQVTITEIEKTLHGKADLEGLIVESDMQWSDAESVEPDDAWLEDEVKFLQSENEDLDENKAYEWAMDDWYQFGMSARTNESQSYWSVNYSESDHRYDILDENGGYVETIDHSGATLGEAQERVFEILEEKGLAISDEEAEERRGAEVVQHADARYQTPGPSKEYRELLLTLPRTDKKNGEMAREMYDKEWSELTGAEKEAIIQKSADSGVKDFTGGHWDEPNVLAHVRFNERTNSAGEDILFIEEVQSDWHQEGRKKGYKGELPKGWSVAQDDKVSNMWQVRNEVGAVVSRGETKEETIDLSRRDTVPNAPFKKTWPMLVMKRMIRYAAENGFEKIAWTPGDIQADRYDLSKQVNSVSSTKRGDFYQISADDKNDIAIHQGRYSENELPDLIGKELAEKIINDSKKNPYQVYTGLDLKVGGEGMKAFYDKMLVNEVNKLFNKAAWGKAKVEVGRIGQKDKYALVDKSSGEYYIMDEGIFGSAFDTKLFDTKEIAESWIGRIKEKSGIDTEIRKQKGNEVEVWSLPITPEMKDKVLNQGQALFSVKSIKDLDKADKNAFNRYTRKMENGEELRKRIKKRDGTGWVGAVVQSITTRQGIDDIIAGKPITYSTPLNDPKSQAFLNRLKKGGESAMWDYLKTSTFMGHSKKPVNCISGSFSECDPSPKCAGVCYAVNGRRNAAIFIKAESTNWGIEKDPIRAAKMTASQYEILLDFNVNKAIRMFDRGEAGTANWTTYINTLNDRGIRAQIFSKKPEFLNSISDFNLKMLSIDGSNTELADANPDIPIALIYEGKHNLALLDKYEDRFKTQGGVILPIIFRGNTNKAKEGWADADITQMPAWAEDYTCPIDAGTKRIKSDKPVSEEEAKKPVWNCMRCDSADGLPGCFFGKSTAKVLGQLPDHLTTEEIQYRIEDLKKYGKEIPDGHREQYNEELDLLISEIRRGRDPGAARELEKEVQAIPDRQRRGAQEGVPVGKRGGKGQIKDEDIEVSDSSKVKFSPKFKKPGKLELPIFSQQQLEKPAKKPATKSKGKVVRKAKPKAVKSDQKLQDQIQKTRMATTGWIASAGRVVRNVDEAASLASFIRKGAQEVTYAILTDKNGLVLEIQRHSKGMIASAPVDGPPLIANTLRTEGAKHIYFVHNHPSMNTDPSPEDANMTQYLKNMASAFDIDVHSFVIGGTSYLDIDTGKQQKITPVLRTVKLPVKERMLNKLAGFDENPTVGNSNDARAYLQNVHKNAEGFLFMNSKLKPVGFLPYSAPTTMKAQTEEFLKAAEEVNASGFVFNSNRMINTTPGRAYFLQALTSQLGGRYQMFEILEQGTSLADTGQINQYRMKDQGVQPKLGVLGTKTPLMSVKKAPGFYSQMSKSLEEKLQGKGTAEQMVAVIDKLAGPPTEITEQISKLEKAEDKTSEDLQRLKQLRKQAGKYKGEFKREELEWSGLLEYFDEQGHPDLETFRAFRGWELTKDLPDRLDADQETKLLKQINAEYDALVKKPFKIKKSDVINWIRANALEIEEVHYHDRKNPYGPIEDEGRIVWPVDAGNEYVATWVNPLTKKEHKFEIKKVELKSGPIWYMIQDGVQQTSSDTEDQARRHANDWADDLYEDSITEASKLEWVEQEVNSLGKKVTVPTWRANAQDPLTGEFVQWEIEKQKESPTWQELGRTHNYVIYQDGEMWDDTAGHSLVEAQRYVEQQIEDAFREYVNEGMASDYLPEDTQTHHETWTMPGGQNYQELLLKLPAPASAERKKLIANFEKKYGGVYGQDFQYRDLEVSEQEAITVAARAADQAIRNKEVFTHSHWPEDNVVAFTRFNDRTDDKGRKVLFLEEVQSDWHQTGREQGYGNKVFTKEDLDIKGNSIALKGTGHAVSNAKDIPIEEKIESALKYFNKYIKIPAGVPDAPFKKSWPLLVIKRMVRWAAKEGYDTIAWTPGMVQVNRYEEAFRKQVDKISWYVSPSKNIKVVNASKGGNQVGVFELDEKGIAIQAFPADAKGLHISKIIGKKMGSQAMEEKEGKVTGDDLAIGGEGMIQAYDVRLVNDVNNFFNKKAWGNAHVEIAGTVTGKEIGEEITTDVLLEAAEKAKNAQDPVAEKWLTDAANQFMNTGQYSMALFNPNPYPGADRPPSHYFDKARKFEDKYQRIWTLPITTEMREKSLEEGMPLFSVKKTLRIPDMTDPSIKDYRVNFSAKDEDHAGHAAAKLFNAGHGEHIVKFDGEWDRSAVDMDPMYQFTLYEGPATGATFVTETLDAEEIDAKFTTIVTPFLENKAVLSAKDRIDPVLQSYIDALKAAQPDAFIASEDLADDPDADLPPEVAAELEASKGLGRRSFGQWLRETSKDIWHSSTRHRPYLDPKEYADVANILRIHQEVPTNSARRAGQVLSAIMGNLKPMQYKVFARKLLMDDMAKDVESGLLADPNNLPFGFNIKTARAYLAKLNAIVDKDPIIKDAIERRTAFNNKIKRALVDAKLLPKAVMEDERYFHHQVLQYRAVREMGSDYYPGIGVSSKDVRLKKKGWQRGRIGSDKSYNSDYAEAEFEVIAQAIAQLETKHTMGRLQDLIDTMPALKTRAKSMNLRQLFINEAARVTKADMSGKIWTPVMIQEEPGMNPLRPFSAEIGKGFSWIGNLAKKGKLENGTRDFTDVIEALEEWQRDVADEKARAKDDGRDPYPIPFPFDELGSRAWAYFNHMMKENLEGAPAAGIIFRAIRQRDAFIKEYLGAQFKTAKDIMPDDHTVWVPAPGTSWYKAHSLSDRIVDAVQAGEMVIGQENADKIKQVLARGRDVEWIIPTDIAKTLDGYDVKLEDHMLSKASRKLMTGWKQWILINPYRVIKYNLNNMSGDLDIALAYDPKIVFKYFGKATKDMYKDWKRKDMSPELQAEIDLAHALGVIGSGWSVQEVGDVTRELSYDRHMQAVTGEKPHLIERGWRGLQGFTNYRENILRLAAFRYFQDRLAAGEKNIYGASNKAEIDGIADNTEKAAKLARELIGDYGNITHSGQWLRRHMIPFYAWMEVNAPRYVRLMRNLRHEGGGAKKIGRALPLLSAKMGWRGTKLAVKASAIYVLVNLWNKLRYPDEEEELGESQRRQLHIIFGRREDGSIITLRFQGALSDALAWFGGEDITHDIADLIKGKVSPAEYAKETFLAPAIKVINAIRPDVKVGAEVLMGRSLYPDPFNPRPIYDKLEHVTRLFSLNTAYGWLAGKPKRGDTIGGMLLNDLMVLGFYNSDPGESAYYDIKSKTFDFLSKTGMERPSVTPTDKGVALYYYKQALKYGDLKAAEKYLEKYIKLGGKSTGVTSSLKRSAPLGSLAKKDHNKFLATLNENEKERYRLALQWYNDTYIRRRNQATIRPTPGTSGLDSVIDGSQTGGKTLREVLNQKNQ